MNNISEIEQEEIRKINDMGHEELCILWRQSPSGHPYFDSSKPYYKILQNRLFNHFGGFTPELSKKIGW